MTIEMVPQACPAGLSRRLGRGAPPVYQMEFICRTSSDFFGEHSGYRLRRARPGLFAIEHQGGLLPPPTRLGGVAVSMGLRPRLSAAAAFAAPLEPRAGARGIISLRIVGATAGGREVASPSSQLGWRKPLEPVAAIIERNMDRQDRQNRLILHPVHPVDHVKQESKLGHGWQMRVLEQGNPLQVAPEPLVALRSPPCPFVDFFF